MDAGHMRRHEPRLLLLAIYSTVIGMVTEVEVLRAFGEEPTARSLVRRRNEILELLRSALLVDRAGPSSCRSVGGLGRLPLPPRGLRVPAAAGVWACSACWPRAWPALLAVARWPRPSAGRPRRPRRRPGGRGPSERSAASGRPAAGGRFPLDLVGAVEQPDGEDEEGDPEEDGRGSEDARR